MTWTTKEWYPVLVRGKDLVMTGEWILCQTGATEVELVHQSGKMCTAAIEDDGVCRVRAEPDLLPLPDEVVVELADLLNLV